MTKAELRKVRDDALEEAAKACKRPAKFLGEVSSTRRAAWKECADAIRALKGSRDD